MTNPFANVTPGVTPGTPAPDPQKLADAEMWMAERERPDTPPTPEFDFEQEFVRRMGEVGVRAERPTILPDGKLAQAFWVADPLGGEQPTSRIAFDPTSGEASLQMLTQEGAMSPPLAFPTRQDAMEFLWAVTDGMSDTGGLPPAGLLAEAAQGLEANKTGIFRPGTGSSGVAETIEALDRHGAVPELPVDQMRQSENVTDWSGTELLPMTKGEEDTAIDGAIGRLDREDAETLRDESKLAPEVREMYRDMERLVDSGQLSREAMEELMIKLRNIDIRRREKEGKEKERKDLHKDLQREHNKELDRREGKRKGGKAPPYPRPRRENGEED